MHIDIQRRYEHRATVGNARVIDADCCVVMGFCTLELPWLNNQTGVSCIPEGEYTWFKRESPANGLVIELEDVPNRTYIQMHRGNFTRDIRGCILAGEQHKEIDGDGIIDVTKSGDTMDYLLNLLPETGTIKIYS